MSTLRDLADAIADKAGIERAVSLGITSEIDATGLKLTRALNDAGRAMTARFLWQELSTEFTFTSTGLATYDLGEAPLRIVGGVIWDGAQGLPLGKPLGTLDWFRATKAGAAGASPVWRVLGGKVELYPSPAVGVIFSVTLASTRWVTAADGTTLQTQFLAETDICRLDPFLLELDGLWRFRRQDGFDWQSEAAEAERQIQLAMSSDRAGESIRPGGSSTLPDPSAGSGIILDDSVMDSNVYAGGLYE